MGGFVGVVPQADGGRRHFPAPTVLPAEQEESIEGLNRFSVAADAHEVILGRSTRLEPIGPTA
jgi:hypothetical protein